MRGKSVGNPKGGSQCGSRDATPFDEGLLCNQSPSWKRECPGFEVQEEPVSVCRDRAPGRAWCLPGETSSASPCPVSRSKGWEAAIAAGSEP